MPVISVFRRQRQEDFHDCEVSLIYTVNLKPVKTIQIQGDLAPKKKVYIYKLKLYYIMYI